MNGTDKVFDSLLMAGVITLGGAAIGWILQFLIPIFWANSTGQIQNATLAKLANDNTLPLVFGVISLFIGLIVAFKSLKHV